MARGSLEGFAPDKGRDVAKEEEQPKSREKVQFAFRISKEDRDALILLARQRGTTAQKLCEQLVEELFEQYGRPC